MDTQRSIVRVLRVLNEHTQPGWNAIILTGGVKRTHTRTHTHAHKHTDTCTHTHTNDLFFCVRLVNQMELIGLHPVSSCPNRF